MSKAPDDYDKELMSARLKQASETLELDLTEKQYQQLLEYLALFIKWNKSYNLTAVRDPEQMLIKHLLDSLSLVPSIEKQSAQRLLDVGTGGGLPGIPLAICFPDRHFSLLDSAGKKMRFLFQVKQSLALENVELHNLRVEQLKTDQKYDAIISRAFASIDDFTALTEHLLAERGSFLAMKGVFPNDELSAVEKNYIVLDHQNLNVPGLDAERCLITLGRRGDHDTDSQ
ncbi:MAG: 16S rRNA (guanine527-N7)-methyltransferase [Flavobacteriales bacterium]|jgi:16S rRNA (guanine527-N7)-methyltransferase